MRVIVTGSRDWKDPSKVEEELDKLWDAAGRQLTVLHGDCRGVDWYADDWATATRFEGVRVERYPAAWKRYGRAAGPIRNRAMVEAGADVCLAFIRNGSRGASGCADMAEKAGIKTIRFEVTG